MPGSRGEQVWTVKEGRRKTNKRCQWAMMTTGASPTGDPLRDCVERGPSHWRNHWLLPPINWGLPTWVFVSTTFPCCFYKQAEQFPIDSEKAQREKNAETLQTWFGEEQCTRNCPQVGQEDEAQCITSICYREDQGVPNLILGEEEEVS